MRGAVLAPGGKIILALPSTSHDGKTSRIVPFLRAKAPARRSTAAIIHYVVTEYGMAHIHGKNIRERAMDLIAIAHPAFRAGLVEEARRLNLVYHDQGYLPGRTRRVSRAPGDAQDDEARPGHPVEARAHQRRAAAEGLLLLALRSEHVRGGS